MHKHTFILVIFYLLCISCTKDIDFDQAKNFEITPVIESSLIFLNESARKLLDVDDEEIEVTQDTLNIAVFNNQIIENNVVKADFVFETNNSINRGFQLQIEFLDALDQVVHNTLFKVSASPINEDIIESFTESFEGTALTALKTARKVVITLTLLSGETITQNSLGRIKLKSKAVFYFILGV